MKTEGRNAVLELIRSGKPIEKIVMEKGAQGSLARIFAEARKHGIRVQFAEDKALDRMSGSGRHQGVIAFAAEYEYADIEDIISHGGEGGFVILCDGIEDVHNLGSIIRVAKVPSLSGAIERLKECGYWLYALEADGQSIYSADLSGKVGLVIGGEDSGVRRLTRERCDGVLSLPLLGKVNSLNASVALGIAAYEVVRCRIKN